MSTIRRLTIQGKNGQALIVDAPTEFIAVLVRDNPDGSRTSEMIDAPVAMAWLRANGILTEYQSESLECVRTIYYWGGAGWYGPEQEKGILCYACCGGDRNRQPDAEVLGVGPLEWLEVPPIEGAGVEVQM